MDMTNALEASITNQIASHPVNEWYGVGSSRAECRAGKYVEYIDANDFYSGIRRIERRWQSLKVTNCYQVVATREEFRSINAAVKAVAK